MANKNKIGIHGPAACGKGTIITILQETFPKHTVFSTGNFARKIAMENNMTIEAYIKYAVENNIPLDDTIDAELKRINKDPGDYLIDSRLGYHFVENCFNVFISIDPFIAAERRYKDIVAADSSKANTLSLQDVFESLRYRDNTDGARYFAKYGTDFRNIRNYDFSISNSLAGKAPFIAGEIIMAYYKWQKQK